jgi:hypothetical protein
MCRPCRGASARAAGGARPEEKGVRDNERMATGAGGAHLQSLEAFDPARWVGGGKRCRRAGRRRRAALRCCCRCCACRRQLRAGAAAARGVRMLRRRGCCGDRGGGVCRSDPARACVLVPRRGAARLDGRAQRLQLAVRPARDAQRATLQLKLKREREECKKSGLTASVLRQRRRVANWRAGAPALCPARSGPRRRAAAGAARRVSPPRWLACPGAAVCVARRRSVSENAGGRANSALVRAGQCGGAEALQCARGARGGRTRHRPPW